MALYLYVLFLAYEKLGGTRCRDSLVQSHNLALVKKSGTKTAICMYFVFILWAMK